uniref:RING-type E3 ubiquitin transferase n=1 Tax=Leersia perrieri TaxID=77586 RepID=A0A0D9WJK9_9ORYZ
MAPPRRSPNPNPLLPAIAVVLLLFPATAAASPYSDHCHGLPSAPDLADGGGGGEGTDFRSLQLHTGYFTGGGERLFGPDPSHPPRSFAFLPSSVVRTTDASLLHVSATLTVSGGWRRPTVGGRHRLFEYDAQHARHQFRPRLPRVIGRRGSVTFGLEGYYSSASGELCMVGNGSGRTADGTEVNLISAVLRVRYPGRANLTSPFVTGSLESTDSPGLFDPVSLVAYAEEGYAYAESASCPPPPAGRLDALQVFEGRKFSCGKLSSMFKEPFRLEYSNGSDLTASSLGLHQRFMFFNRMRCADDGAVRAYVVFSNQTDAPKYYFTLGEKAMVVEGFWDDKRNRLCLKGCHVVNSAQSRADLSVGECGIGMSFWFPAVWTLQERSFSAGLIWNASLTSGEGIAASSSTIPPYIRGSISGLKYNYTKVDEARKYYEKYGLNKKRKGKFPDSNSYRDLTFRFFLQKGGGSGYASPVTIGSMLYDGNSLVALDLFSHVTAENQRLLNVSYDFQYVGNWSLETFRRQHISAEGVYDAKTGSLCMIACRVVNISSDCEILVTAQFASLDTKAAQHVKGTIRSLRKKTDPLFFEPLDIASYGLYIDQVDESIWRMDLESTMALISMTLSCLFIAVQLFHVKKVPEALPAMSITMLVVLSLGYMIPLVLNFEALFKNSNKQTVPLSGGGWLEVNEVIVRVITMVTFLMQLRLLQLAWSARSVDVSKDQSWAAEKKVLWICLPLYIIGAVVTWVVHMRFNNNRRMLRKVARFPRVINRHSFWEDLVSYGGLILDGFLLPQIVLNAFSGSKVKALSPGFYIGSTMIRALPHVYDLFRAKHFVPSLRPFYRYANPRDDLFSLAWDIAIPCGAILLSLLLFFQQRLGGSFFLCLKNNSKSSEYEMVSTVSS